MADWDRNKGNDHWWPRALQKYWCDDDGQIFVTSSKGTAARSRSNKKVGARRGWHHVDFGESPWTHSFEKDFGSIDNEIPRIIDWIYENLPPPLDQAPLLPKWVTRHLRTSSTLTCLPLTLSSDLLNLTLSLLIRLPAFKNLRMQQPISWGLPEDQRIGTIEIGRYYHLARSVLYRTPPRGFYLFIHSRTAEFIYGDGLLDNLTPSLVGFNLRGHCLVPLTPKLCLFFTTSLEGAYVKQVGSTLASQKMVDEINSITRTYSKDVFFSTAKGWRYPAHVFGEHQALVGHRNMLIDSFLSGTFFR